MEDILFMRPEQVRTLQEGLLRKMIDLCFRGHPFYRRRFKEIGLRESDIRTIDDLEKIPPTFKKDYISDPESFRLNIEDLPLPERLLWDVMFTAGTSTGQPVPFYTTAHDFFANLDLQRKCGSIRGFRNSDVMANLYPLTLHPHGAFTRAINSATVLGCPVVSGLTGAPYPEFPVHNSIQQAVDLVVRTRATVIWAVPSFLRRFLITATEKKADLSSARLFALSGERVGKALRDDLRERASLLGATNLTINVSLGMTEMQAGCVECEELSGFHNPDPGMFYLEILDQETYRRLPDGKLGMLALTHLNRRGTVLLRYVLGDLTSLSHEKCPRCGRTSERIVSNPLRVGELTKIRGMLVNKATLQEHMISLKGIDAFQVVLTKADPDDALSMDEVIIKVASSVSQRETLEEEIIRRVKEGTGVRPRIEFVEKDYFQEDQGMKMRGVVDIRKNAD
jgi:phenylacetate-CoA ligase